VKKTPALIAVVMLLVIAVLALPTKQRCGGPGLACATALDKQGYVHYYYEVEPVGVYLAEIITGSNIRIFYRSGEDLERVR
jgi:hypothetical protein